MYRTAIVHRRLATLLTLVALAFGFTAISAVAAAAPAHAADGPADVTSLCVVNPVHGNWHNTNPNTNAMTRVNVVAFCGVNRITAFGKCHPTDCAWGTRTATFSSGWLRTVYHFGFKTSTVWVKTYVYSGTTYLRVYVQNDFTAADGRTDYVTDEWMIK